MDEEIVSEEVPAESEEAPADEDPTPEGEASTPNEGAVDSAAEEETQRDREVEADPLADSVAIEPGLGGGFAPGGYYRPGEVLERSPVDGQRNIVVGSILVPLGTLATVTSAVGIWMTAPEHCVERLGSAGATIEDPASCRGVFTFNVIRVTYGGLMLISGSVILAIGLVQRQRYRRWREERGMRAWLMPAPRGGASAGLRLRF